MGFHLSLIVVFLILRLVASHARLLLLPSQLYWNSVLPNSPMPKALSELVQPVGPAKNFINDYNQDAALDNIFEAYHVATPVEKLFVGYNCDVQLLTEDPTRIGFFFEKELHPGTTLKYISARNATSATFMSHKTVNSIPFSSAKLPEILNRFSIKSGSVEADVMKDTIKKCETPTMRGEEGQCTTSLESMVDFTTSKLGTNIQAISTEVEKGASVTKPEYYTIAFGVKKLVDEDKDNLIVCHKLRYPYAVYYCHGLKKTRAYLVPLEGADGTKVKAVAIFHVDTSKWNPKNFVLQVLRVRPGAVPVCHFLPDDHIAWVLNWDKPTLLGSIGSV